MMVEINNLSGVSLDKVFLKEIANKVLKRKKFELSIVLVKPTIIKKFNKKYRKKNRPTDVLSFFYGDSGEIVICPQEVKKNAKKFKTTYKKELARVLIHGILHLLGYNHEKSEKEAKEVEETKVSSSPFAAARVMEEKENYYLKLCLN